MRAPAPPEPGAPDVSVVVPAFGAPPALPGLLQALQRQSLDPDRFEVIVVDSGVDGGARQLEDLAKEWRQGRLRLVRGPLTGGPAGRRNAGAAAARGRVLAFTDSDCTPEPDWLAAGLAALDAGAEVIQGRTLAPEGAPLPRFSHRVIISRESGLFETCNMFYARSLFERLGGFSTVFFSSLLVPFGEDAELGWRARRAGASFRFQPGAVVRHEIRPRSISAQLRYEWGGRGFPLLVRHAPELRRRFLHAGVFLSADTAKFDAALAGAALAPRSPPAALLALPYMLSLLRERPRDVPARVASDAVRATGLLWGSARWRAPVL